MVHDEFANSLEDGSVPAGTGRCVECRSLVDRRDMVAYRDQLVCAGCRDVFFQKVREGVELTPATVRAPLRYAGFWIRALATVIDWIAFSFVDSVVTAIFRFVVSHGQSFVRTGRNISGAEILLLLTVEFLIAVTGATLFVGGLGGTPGKLALGLRIVRADGSRIGYSRAFWRTCAEFLSGFIFGLGYLVAANDPEKRTYHDRRCDTRVIRG